MTDQSSEESTTVQKNVFVINFPTKDQSKTAHILIWKLLLSAKIRRVILEINLGVLDS
jgi:hypothetical protein